MVLTMLKVAGIDTDRLPPKILPTHENKITLTQGQCYEIRR